jgi:hypothetical protein
MTVFQNSTSRWVYHAADTGAYHYFNSQQEAEKMAAYNTIGETPAEYEIAATVTGALLPQLRDALLALQSLKMAWYANAIPEMIETAGAAAAEIAAATEEEPTTLTEADTLIAGLPVSAWIAWGAVLTGLETWLSTPLEGLNVTPTAVLAKRYTRKG